MKNRIFLSLLSILASLIGASAENSQLSRLDEAIANRNHFLKIKEARVDSLRHLVTPDSDKKRKLELYNKLFQEYLAFNFDSAMVYVNNAAKLINADDSYDTQAQVSIHRALSLATSGHFSHAVDILKCIDSGKLSKEMKEEYFSACEWTYGVWAEYSDKHSIAPGFTAKSLAYLDSLIDVTEKSSVKYSYRKAERHLRSRDYSSAEKEYLTTLDQTPIDDRLYAQAAYALALTYKELGDKKNYKKWLINAAISDQTVPLKENLALQQLALFLNNEEGDLERANSYLELALEDAIFYNNRLRMLEIAEKIPDITNVYNDKIRQQNNRLKFYILIIGIMMLLIGVIAYYVYGQRKKVSRAKDALSELNERLTQLNARLTQTNNSREQYVSLFMDLCAAYIDKLNRFPMVLKLKVKQMGDLNSVADRYVRPSEAEMREMFHNFDTAFLRLYPDFISGFNALLQPDKQIFPKKGELLNTDLRIYALVRMGITDSNKIAILLFLSPQTIFNHRTQARNRAINRETFEKEVSRICEVKQILCHSS